MTTKEFRDAEAMIRSAHALRILNGCTYVLRTYKTTRGTYGRDWHGAGTLRGEHANH